MKKMDEETMRRIYTDKKLRNAIAYAHAVCEHNGKEIYKKAMYYPIDYSVSIEQIQEAKREIEADKKRILKKHKNTLIFVGMGMTYETKTNVGNHRIRTYLKDKEWNKFFVEFGTAANNEFTRCDHSIKYDGDETINNYKRLETAAYLNGIRYTPENILKIVNDVFKCDFKNIFIDNYTLSCDEYISHC
jgi:hypothetical protein